VRPGADHTLHLSNLVLATCNAWSRMLCVLIVLALMWLLM
jgi:hypothetical protein